jgi:hypothetical protein
MGVHESVVNLVCCDIGSRLASLFTHWQDKNYKETMLFPVIEEAFHYYPQEAGLEVKALVVLCVRNSLLEDLQSDYPYHPKIKKLLSDKHIPLITSEAIQYWNKVNFNDLVIDQVNEDMFGEIPNKYPTSWSIFLLFSQMQELELDFEPFTYPPSLINSSSRIYPERDNKVTVLSGIDPAIDSNLLNFLIAIQQGEMKLFFSSSFKHITRNTEKLFKVLDIVLSNGGYVLTPNYFFTNGYVSRRRKLLRPTHMSLDIKQFADNHGISENHREALSIALNKISNE